MGKIFVIIFLSLISLVALAQQEKAVAVGMYLGAVDLFEKAKASECGYLFRDDDISLTAAVEEIKQSLSIDLQNELDMFLKSDKFRKEQEENSEILAITIKLARGETDKEKACKVLSRGLIRPLMEIATERWNAEK